MMTKSVQYDVSSAFFYYTTMTTTTQSLFLFDIGRKRKKESERKMMKIEPTNNCPDGEQMTSSSRDLFSIYSMFF
jgi:hypothetical protein